MAGKKERQRKLAREHYERQQVRRVEQQRRMRLIGGIGGAVVVVAALVAGGIVLFSGGSGGKPAAAATKPSSSPSATPSASPTPSASASTAAVTEPAKHCTYIPNPPASRKASLPPATPDYKANYVAAISTNLGTIKIDLLNSKATCTVNSFVSLASQSYFSNTHCHRLTTSGIYVLQCGDPTGTGSGGPGYKFSDENLAGATYPAGTIAMANSGPNTNGSQFFIVYQNTNLPPSYTPFGTVVSGLGIVQNVAKAGTDNSNGQGDGHPKEAVDIQSVKITKS
ncbi:MAG TPA: peptidylprolyl isomerase [Streptosporangiaceae bacterium]|nr:peptidylprolyl isomerase [Streptosporangiaceae bacterium]